MYSEIIRSVAFVAALTVAGIAGATRPAIRLTDKKVLIGFFQFLILI